MVAWCGQAKIFIDFHGNVILEQALSLSLGKCGANLISFSKLNPFKTQAKIFIDFHGNVIAEHAPSRAWDVRPNPYTLHPTPYTLHPEPYTLVHAP